VYFSASLYKENYWRNIFIMRKKETELTFRAHLAVIK